MEKHILKAVKRTLVGRKVSSLRKQGITPANIYGKNIKSAAVQVNVKDFIQVFKQAGETGLVELQLEDKKLPVLIHNIQVDPITEEPLHVDFYQVNMKEKVKAEVPLEFIGESKVVKEGSGIFSVIIDEISVECLPGDLVDHIDVDISSLKEFGDAIRLSDLTLPKGMELMQDDTSVICMVEEPKKTEEAPVVEAEEKVEAKAGEEKEEGEKTEEEKK